jgi:C_GCAxxG_C_C family probable redox protein
MNTISDKNKKEICHRCGLLLDDGWHCSEAMIVGVGQLLTPVHPQVLKASNGFRGGIGSSKEELCGALSGGVMVISLLHGRTDARTNDDRGKELCVEYLHRFNEEFGCVKCSELKANWVGKPGQEKCVQLVEKAAGILLEVLGE